MSHSEAPPSLEAALARLEALVQEMESGELGLEDVIARFEEGSRLAKFCREKLEAAERRIEKIVKEAGVPVGVEPWEKAEE